MIRLLLKLVRCQHGSAMIELCLILPVLILILLGALDVGIFIEQDMKIADSVRAAVQYDTIYTNASDATNISNMQIYAGQFTGNNIPHYNAVATITCTCGPGGSAVACTGTCAGNVMPAQYAQVTATATLPLIFGVTGLPASISVKSVARGRVAWKDGM